MGDFDNEADDALPPSKSQRKRDAHAAQKLGERLVDMRESDLADLPLEESLREAIAAARRITSRGARARQLQYIGKLMRAADMGAIEAALAAREDAHRARARLRQ
jgi:ribosome-associated protein